MEDCEVSRTERTTALSLASMMCLGEIKRSNKRQQTLRVVTTVSAVTFQHKYVFITQQRNYCHIPAPFINGKCGHTTSPFAICEIHLTGQ
jgi:hypothetical protein